MPKATELLLGTDQSVTIPATKLPVLGTTEVVTLGSYVSGIAPVGNGEFLWITDSDNHRVLRIRDPLTNPIVDVILGQTDPYGVECNRGLSESPSADTLCFPGALSLGRHGNLYVSDFAEVT